MIFLAMLAVPGFDAAVVRFLPKAEEPVRLINFFLTLSAIIATAVAAIFVAGLPFLSPAIGFVRGNIFFFLAFVSFVVFLALSRLTDSVFIAGEKSRLRVLQSNHNAVTQAGPACSSAPLLSRLRYCRLLGYLGCRCPPCLCTHFSVVYQFEKRKGKYPLRVGKVRDST